MNGDEKKMHTIFKVVAGKLLNCISRGRGNPISRTVIQTNLAKNSMNNAGYIQSLRAVP